MSLRWIQTRGFDGDGMIPDAPLFETEDGLALAGIAGPTLILSFGEYRLHLTGEETLSNVAEAISAAFDEQQRRQAERG